MYTSLEPAGEEVVSKEYNPHPVPLTEKVKVCLQTQVKKNLKDDFQFSLQQHQKDHGELCLRRHAIKSGPPTHWTWQKPLNMALTHGTICLSTTAEAVWVCDFSLEFFFFSTMIFSIKKRVYLLILPHKQPYKAKSKGLEQRVEETTNILCLKHSPLHLKCRHLELWSVWSAARQ